MVVTVTDMVMVMVMAIVFDLIIVMILFMTVVTAIRPFAEMTLEMAMVMRIVVLDHC